MIVGSVRDKRDQAGGEHRAGADVADVGAPDLAGAHLRNQEGQAGGGVVGEVRMDRRERRRHVGAQQRDERQQHQPRQHAAGEHRAGDARADDVADAQVLGRDVDVERGVRELAGARHRVADVLPEEVEGPRQRLPQRADAEAAEHQSGQLAAALAGDQHFGARRAFGVGQHAVFLDDQRAAQRHHHQHAEDAAGKRQHRDLRVVEVLRDRRAAGRSAPGS